MSPANVMIGGKRVKKQRKRDFGSRFFVWSGMREDPVPAFVFG